MSNRRRKLIAYESDEETEDSSLNLSIPTDFLHPSSSVGPSHGRDTLEYPRLLATSPSSELELVGNRGGPASGSSENHSSGGLGSMKKWVMVREAVPSRADLLRRETLAIRWRRILTLLTT